MCRDESAETKARKEKLKARGYTLRSYTLTKRMSKRHPFSPACQDSNRIGRSHTHSVTPIHPLLGRQCRWTQATFVVLSALHLLFARSVKFGALVDSLSGHLQAHPGYRETQTPVLHWNIRPPSIDQECESTSSSHEMKLCSEFLVQRTIAVHGTPVACVSVVARIQDSISLCFGQLILLFSFLVFQGLISSQTLIPMNLPS